MRHDTIKVIMDNQTSKSNTRRVEQSRRGITLIELLCVIGFLYFAYWVLSSSAYRAVEIVETITGEGQNVFVAAFILTLFCCICIAVGIYRLRIRYNNLLYFPLMAGLPLGFAAVPFHPFTLPVYISLLAAALIVIPFALFCVQMVFWLFIGQSPTPKRTPIPEVLPPYPPDFTPVRARPTSMKDYPEPRHPNLTQKCIDYQNSVGIYREYAREAYLYDHCIDEFRSQLSLYCQKNLLHYKQRSGYLRFWERGYARRLEEIILPCAALDFDGTRDWVEYVIKTFPRHSYILSLRDERLILAMCAVIMNDDDKLEHMNRELKKPTGRYDQVITQEQDYWEILIAGIAERNAERCMEAIRIQAEEWYSPSVHCRLNMAGVAMTNLCRWRGIPVPALEPVIPESLLTESQ